jgi:hypothetical protein
VRPPLLDLIGAYAAGRTDFPLASLPRSRVGWALECGLGPLLARTCRDDPGAASSPDWSDVRAADLAARVVTEDQADATVELLEACSGRVGAPTLLKGIWLSHAVYPEPHLRPMRDVDLLVEPHEVGEVEQVLHSLGYLPLGSTKDYAVHHHAMPYRHPKSGVWVEVHRGLLPRSSPSRGDALFSPDHVRASRRPASFRGRPVHCLSAEMQVVYLAAHWAASLEVVGAAGGLLVLIDFLGLAPSVDWDLVLRGLPGQAVASALVVVLRYLETRGLLSLPPRVREGLWRSQKSFGEASLSFLHLLMDLRLLDGRAYGRWVRSRRNLEIVWATLLRPQAAWRNVLALPWSLLPERWRGLPSD